MQGTKNLTQGPIKRQLFNLALPIMGTSFIQMAYSITDMAWVGRLGSEAVAAIGAVGILTWMTNSISLLNKVGSEVSVGQSIGARNEEDARSYSSHNLTIALLISICWGLLLFVFANPIIGIYKLEAPIAANAVEYLRIISTAFPFIFLSAAFTGIHNAAGLSKIPFYISGAGLIMNMILDPVFIFVFDMGTAGVIAGYRMRPVRLPAEMEKQITGRLHLLCQIKEKLFEKDIAIRITGCHAEYAVCHHQYIHGPHGIYLRRTYRVNDAHRRRTDRSHCVEHLSGIQHGIERICRPELCRIREEQGVGSLSHDVKDDYRVRYSLYVIVRILWQRSILVDRSPERGL